MDSAEELELSLAPQRQALVEHPVYAAVRGEEQLRLFAAHHVFAVWDFMCLLKELQRRLTCVQVPYLPVADGAAARLINEIVLGEESDDVPGGPLSHYELYRRAMAAMHAPSRAVDCFLFLLRGGATVPDALGAACVPEPSAAFVEATFALLAEGSLPAIAAAFTYGREDVIPDMFRHLVASLDEAVPGAYQDYRLYLERHIHVDGDQHGPMARRLLGSLCGRDPEKWSQAADGARRALVARRALWDGILVALDDGRARPRAAA